MSAPHTRSGPLLVLACGSSAAISLPGYLSALRQRLTCPVSVVMTHTAERFVSAEVLGWFATEVVTASATSVNPIELAQVAGAVVVLPATGNVLATAALGLMPTPVTTILAAVPQPVLWFPHMHPVVWGRAATAGHVERLRERGDTVVDPEQVEGYELSRRETRVGPSMPPVRRAVDLVAQWWESGAAGGNAAAP